MGSHAKGSKPRIPFLPASVGLKPLLPDSALKELATSHKSTSGSPRLCARERQRLQPGAFMLQTWTVSPCNPQSQVPFSGILAFHPLTERQLKE